MVLVVRLPSMKPEAIEKRALRIGDFDGTTKELEKPARLTQRSNSGDAYSCL
jgi:hypothetical protein